MDFPIFHLDFIGNRMLIAVTAIIHVIVNHPMAVGAVPLVTFMEWMAYRKQDVGLDRLANRLTFVFFIITTSLGALTGVGIWFTTSLVNPDAIGSLLRVFFWGWFAEWIVFVIEVCLIMYYFLSWKKVADKRKKHHIRTGIFLSVFSWITMAVITGILGFMMNSGKWIPYIREWSSNSGLFTAFFNPLYIPQLAFRTPLALMTAGLFFLFLIPFFTKKGDALRSFALRFLSTWTLIWLPFTSVAAVWYWKRIPEFMAANAPVALATQAYTSWYNTILFILVGMIFTILLVCLLGVSKPKWLPTAVIVLPFILGVGLLGSFERVREFVRKPYVIEDYMYANGLLVQDYALYQEDGVLPHATFVKHHQVTEENKIEAGKDVFMLTCSRCHTVNGINSVNNKFKVLYPQQKWEEEQIAAFIVAMHNIRQFMPPYPGNEKELNALAAFICQIQNREVRFEGVQTSGVPAANVP